MVWGKPETVSVYRKSKTVWIARGNYMGKHIEVKARSESAAVGSWREAAAYWGS
jgi:hypothetical protein